MADLDGHYEHAGVTARWNEKKLKLARGEESHRIKWRDVTSVDAHPGFVQVLVDGHVPPGDPQRDPLSIPVASEADANRLMTIFAWHVEARRAS